MAKFQSSQKFESSRQTWETPAELFDYLNNEYCFSLDVAASAGNSKCTDWIDDTEDALAIQWSGICWCNPPYGSKKQQLKDWVRKAYHEGLKPHCVVIMLIPCRTNTVWWHEYVMKAKAIRFIKGRPKFGDCKHGLPQPLAVVVFDGHANNTKYDSIDLLAMEQRQG